MTQTTPKHERSEPLIHRQVSFRLSTFDRLKDYQRSLERTSGRQLCNSELLERLILSHPDL